MPQIIIKLGDNVVQNFTFDKAILNIGRSRDNDIVLDNLAVSRNHSRIRLIDSKFILTDLNSANGTFVNGVRVTKTEVMDEDIISIGKHKLIFKLEGAREEEEIGDAFTADRTMIVEQAAEGALVVTKGKNKGQRLKLTKYETSIGRATENDLVLNDWFVSKVHAKIIKQGNNYILKDLGSWKGSFVNDKAIKEPTVLNENDELRFGSTKLVFGVHDENKILQIERRRPEELAYEESAAADAGPSPFESPDMAAEEAMGSRGGGAFEDEPELEPEEEKGPSSLAEYGMGSNTEDEEDDLDFESLPDPAAVTPEPVSEPAAIAKDFRPPAFEPDPSNVSWTDYSSTENKMVTPPPAAASSAAHSPAAHSGNGESAPAPAASSPPAPEPAAAAVTDATDAGAADGDKMVKVWEKALTNKSPIIRKQAAKMLKKLTGKDYDVPE